MAFENEQQDLIHDVRLVRHHIRRGKLERKDHQDFLDGLEDVASMGTATVTRFAEIWQDPGDDDGE